MAIAVEIPKEIEERLRVEWPDLEQHVLEAYAVEAFRRGELSSSQVARILSMAGRWEAMEFLSKHGAYPGYGVEDFEEDMKTLDELETRTPR